MRSIDQITEIFIAKSQSKKPFILDSIFAKPCRERLSKFIYSLSKCQNPILTEIFSTDRPTINLSTGE
ncbi:hypothetical protein C7B67_04110 [filamentous cyanobacterium Phorm 6]|nr:hypothetical protein C7B67_04110 [filamentous cyanobacterium Phorm 6]